MNIIALGNRDYYQVALALQEKGKLGKLITDFYCPDFMRSTIKKRFSSELSSKKTISFIFFIKLFNLFFTLFKFRKPSFYETDYFFGFISGFFTWITCNEAIVYSYYIEGFNSFYKFFKLKPKKFIIFQVHPTPWHIKKILDMDKNISNINFEDEIEINFTKEQMKNYYDVLNSADRIICASTFTKVSLESYSNILPKIDVVSYGTKFDIDQRFKKVNSSNKIKLLSVCQLIHRKGMHYAFEAFNKVEDNFEWTIVSNSIDKALLSLVPKNVKILNNVSDEQLKELYYDADLFVMPSLIEGFGLVYLESLSFGTPVLYTENTGMNDIIENNINGFKVKTGSTEDIVNVFTSITKDRSLLNMEQNCKTVIKEFNWSRFRKKIYNIASDRLGDK